MKPVGLFGSLVAVSALSLVGLSTGCNQKEEILDVETPNAEVEVTRDKSNGQVDVDVEDK